MKADSGPKARRERRAGGLRPPSTAKREAGQGGERSEPSCQQADAAEGRICEG